jgi:hypothetical protein
MEIWKDIPNYEEYYQVSNLGRLKSFKMNKETILKGGISKSGYHKFVLILNKKKKYYSTHQLVAMAFLNHKPCGFKLVVNHKNFNKLDNSLENLEVISHRENTNRKHIKSESKYVGVQRISNTNKYKAVISINGKDKVLGQFYDEKEASEYYEKALISLKNGSDIEVKKAVFSSNYKGITFFKSRQNWLVRIKVNNKWKFVGYFKTEQLAKEYLTKLNTL